jgi:hypothetical protein
LDPTMTSNNGTELFHYYKYLYIRFK